MNRRSFLLVGICALLAATSSGALAQTKIMPLGDSITQGAVDPLLTNASSR